MWNTWTVEQYLNTADVTIVHLWPMTIEWILIQTVGLLMFLTKSVLASWYNASVFTELYSYSTDHTKFKELHKILLIVQDPRFYKKNENQKIEKKVGT